MGETRSAYCVVVDFNYTTVVLIVPLGKRIFAILLKLRLRNYIRHVYLHQLGVRK